MIGLGLVGLLLHANSLLANGCIVIGVDNDEKRLEESRRIWS